MEQGSPRGMGEFDWPGLMRLGLGELRLPPTTFWQLTPRELMMMAGMAEERTGRFGRARLRELEKLASGYVRRANGGGRDGLE